MPQRILVEVSGDNGDTAYVKFSESDSQVVETVRIESLIAGYKGPMVNFDLDENKRLVGIEIVVFTSQDG